MPRVPKPTLLWSSNEDGDGVLSAALVDKRVWLHGYGVRQKTPFQIRRRNLLGRIPHLGRRLFGGWVSNVPTLHLGDGHFRSVTYWQASSNAPPLSSTDYYFIDGNGGESGTLAVSNTPTFRWKSVERRVIGLKPMLALGLATHGYARMDLGHYDKSYELQFEGEVLAPRDPEVEIEVLNPGTSRDALVNTAENVLYHEFDLLSTSHGQASTRESVLSDYQHYQFFAPAMRHIDSFLGRRYIDIEIHGDTRFTAGPDKPNRVSLTVRGDGPVRLLFAIQVLDVELGTRTISELMPIKVLDRRGH